MVLSSGARVARPSLAYLARDAADFEDMAFFSQSSGLTVRTRALTELIVACTFECRQAQRGPGARQIKQEPAEAPSGEAASRFRQVYEIATRRATNALHDAAFRASSGCSGIAPSHGLRASRDGGRLSNDLRS